MDRPKPDILSPWDQALKEYGMQLTAEGGFTSLASHLGFHLSSTRTVKNGWLRVRAAGVGIAAVGAAQVIKQMRNEYRLQQEKEAKIKKETVS